MSTPDSLSRLTRYESAFELLSEINATNEIALAASLMARRLKYVADVFSWRYLSIARKGIGSPSNEENVMVIDGYRGTAAITHVLPDDLSRVESNLWANHKTCFLADETLERAKAVLPNQFQKDDIVQVYVCPHFGAGEIQGLSIFSRRRQALHELDIKFITIAAQFFHEKIYMLWEQQKLRDLEQAFLQQELALRQNEKLATLGKLSAGVAHELNNPAAAAQRGTAYLRDTIIKLESISMCFAALNFEEAHAELLARETDMMLERAKSPLNIDPLTRSDYEYELENWLTQRNIEEVWDIAPLLTSIGYTSDRLAEIAHHFTEEQFDVIVHILAYRYQAFSILEEIGQGTGRISEIVKALKSYSYMDQAPSQSVNIHDGLDSTLIMLGSKLKAGVEVRREYAENLPKIEAYGSELNQVWTNLIDNAISAMNEKGEIHIKTYATETYVVVEITDNGPGIPSDIQPKIFDPFFTTKAPGEGTGLGLNISHNIIVQKHKGRITVESKPGETRFTIKLPIN